MHPPRRPGARNDGATPSVAGSTCTAHVAPALAPDPDRVYVFGADGQTGGEGNNADVYQ